MVILVPKGTNITFPSDLFTYKGEKVEIKQINN